MRLVPQNPISEPFCAAPAKTAPLWRAVLRFYAWALVLSVLTWGDASFGYQGRLGGAGSEPHAALIPIATLAAGAIAFSIAL